jgi:hypothetical protein
MNSTPFPFSLHEFKRSNISKKDICFLFSLLKSGNKKFFSETVKFVKNNKFLSSLTTLTPTFPINFPLYGILKKLNKLFKKNMMKIAKTVEAFFLQMSIDPTFISLDTEFNLNPNETTFKNLINYVKLRNEQFISSLNLNKKWKTTLTIMSDDRIPMYNEDNKHNTYDNFIAGNIKFSTRDEYVYSIRNLGMSPHNSIKYYPFRGILVSSKVGQNLSERIEYTGIGVFGAGVLLIGFSAYEIESHPDLDEDPEYDELLTIIFFIGLILLFVGFVIEVLNQELD